MELTTSEGSASSSGSSSGSGLTSTSGGGSSSGAISSGGNSSSSGGSSGSSSNGVNIGGSTSVSQVQGGADSSSSSSSSGTTGAAGGVGSGGVSVAMIRQPSLQQSGIVSVSVPKDMATAGSGFSFPLPAQVANTATGGNAVITVMTVTGQSLPGWIKFNPETKTFVASAVPDGAFPMQVVVTVAGRSTTIVISERTQ